MTAYYNEIDEYAAQWLRNLIKAGHIAPGDVDTRSIEDVSPDDLKQYTQCHFFAGIGVWSHALRRAGWADDRPVWTGSCPCQPFSVAGKGDGFADERHLWPAFFHLIEARRPVTVFGEQVASKDGYAWLYLVQADLEGSNYAFGAVVAPAAGFGAPHQRHRMYWVAYALQPGRTERGTESGSGQVAGCCVVGGLADTYGGNTGTEGIQRSREHGQFTQDRSVTGGLGDTDNTGPQGRGIGRDRTDKRVTGAASMVVGVEHPKGYGRKPRRTESGWGRIVSGRPPGGNTIDGGTGAMETNGFWSAADWIYCRDEKYRPVEPGTFPLAHGATARVGRLRAYGNAICAPQAEEFVKAYLEVRP